MYVYVADTALPRNTINILINLTRMATARALSGLQKEVLSLYRKILRQAVQKDRLKHVSKPIPSFTSLIQGKDDNHSSIHFAAKEFRKQAQSVKRSDFKRIEYMIRKGEKQLKLLQMTGVKDIGGSKPLS